MFESSHGTGLKLQQQGLPAGPSQSRKQLFGFNLTIPELHSTVLLSQSGTELKRKQESTGWSAAGPPQL